MNALTQDIQRFVAESRLGLPERETLPYSIRFATHPDTRLNIDSLCFNAANVAERISKDYGVSLHAVVVRNHTISSLAKYIDRIISRRRGLNGSP